MMRSVIIAVVIALGLLSGCGEMRPFPSHGGGKRFDEEQRAVAGAIRETVAGIDLQKLQGKRVLVLIESVAQDGGGYTLGWPGLRDVGISGSTNNSSGWNRYPNGVYAGENENEGFSASGFANFTTQMTYVTHAFGSSSDLNYLKATLEMKARLEGVTLVPADPEVMLYVLVDVIGTNRSREDRLFWNMDKLGASCECTYYAMDARTGTVLMPAARTGASASYEEEHYLAANKNTRRRYAKRETPQPLVLASTARPATQPAK